MRRHRFAMSILAVLFGAYCFWPPRPSSGQQKNLSAKTAGKSKKTAPVMPDFKTALALSFDSLTELSRRIRTARAAYDPVSLAVAAVELDAAEKVSGKKATVTADALKEEAAELAEVRFDAVELQAVALLCNMPELNSVAKRAAQAAAQEKAAVVRGEKTRGMSVLEVRNETPSAVAIIVDGKRKGSVAPGKARTFDDVKHTNGLPVVLLHANDLEGNRVAEWPVAGEFKSLTWTVNEQ